MLASTTSRVMVGRDRELQSLQEAVQRCLAGVPQGALVLGEAGIGKTRLLAELVGGLPPSVRVARGQCIARGSLAPPLGPVREVLRDVCAHVGAETFLRCAGPAAHVLSALLPELGQDAGVELRQEQVEDAVRLLLETVSVEVPLVVLVEDLHWADLPTLDLLRAFLQLLRRSRVLVVVTCRTDEPDLDDPVREFLLEAGRYRGLTQLELSRLDPQDAARQVELVCNGPLDKRVVKELVRRGDGIAYSFRHALTHEAVHAELLPGERTRLHSRYAAALATGPATPGRAAEVAHHHLLAQELPEALGALVRAARETVAGGAPLNGGELGLRALELWDEVPDAESRAGCTLARLAHEVAIALNAGGDDRALAVLDTALARVGREDPTGRALLLHEAMVVRYGYGRSGGLSSAGRRWPWWRTRTTSSAASSVLGCGAGWGSR